MRAGAVIPAASPAAASFSRGVERRWCTEIARGWLLGAPRTAGNGGGKRRNSSRDGKLFSRHTKGRATFPPKSLLCCWPGLLLRGVAGGAMARPTRSNRPPRPQASGLGEKRIPDSYIVILQPTVTPYEMLSTVLKGYKPTFTYGSIFTGFAVDRVPWQKADQVRL